MCTAENGGRWTCADCSASLAVFRGLIRNLQGWHSAFEAGTVSDVILGPDGREWSMWDLDKLYETRVKLPHQMRRAVELFLYDNTLERDAAKHMGVSETSPVAIYATVGLTRMLGWARDGEIPGCAFDFEVDMKESVDG